MASEKAWGAGDHRRFAQQFMPPGEFRDGYLDYLDEVELKEPGQTPGDAPAAGGGPASPPSGASTDDGAGWPVQRYVIAAVGSVAFAYGTWYLTSLL